MYSETSGSRKTLGDVDVLYHDGIYHLFHLVLPNHDFIAHAVSDNCMNWRRVENALFLGHPGSWDDSMLWTIHVSPNPHRQGSWRMFYTGLSRRDHGQKQRIGMAESDDLYTWRKAPVSWKDGRSALPYDLPGRPAQPPFEYDASSCFPLDPDGRYYEAEFNEGRHWLSWRDPFYYREGKRGWLLAAGRVNHGPVVRRGCVAVMEETAPNRFEARPPLHHPGLYDDVEVPNLFKIDGEYYLVGSMREDAKIRYWHTTQIDAPWRSYADNVLLAEGNYAGRVCQDDRGLLLWNFFTPGAADRLSNNLMPPPKRLSRCESGQLHVHTFEGFQSVIDRPASLDMDGPLKDQREGALERPASDALELHCGCGFQIFALRESFRCFRLQASLKMLSEGKCGLVFRLDRQTHDGYYLSLDLFKGVAQLRAWGSGPDGSGEEMMQFRSIQSAFWEQKQRGEAEIKVLAYGSYLEVSIGGRVRLSLADQTFTHGALGFCVESARVQVTDLRVDHYLPPAQTDEHLANG
ncbi:hypothetical protein Mal15_68750 [Stieleria maiorica]|uniref:Glycosyl hydrolase family 32 N-terminal domain-containing protein n=1 Tax=Stieleria maiorica TaxID=2795974 RepID=A0A5B9MPB3_9BACT|nr:glycosyl hydrolase [Stieleria maiorica]QEG02754.1 hypothetical protein Mal15_68750 [Stieleria maiorica]